MLPLSLSIELGMGIRQLMYPLHVVQALMSGSHFQTETQVLCVVALTHTKGQTFFSLLLSEAYFKFGKDMDCSLHDNTSP